MADLTGIIKQLIAERNRLNEAIAALEIVSNGASRKRSSTKRTFSAKTLARMAAAQRARWAKIKRKKKT